VTLGDTRWHSVTLGDVYFRVCGHAVRVAVCRVVYIHVCGRRTPVCAAVYPRVQVPPSYAGSTQRKVHRQVGLWRSR